MRTRRTSEHQVTDEVNALQRARAVRAVAAAASDATECARLLDMLGLTALDRDPVVPAPRVSITDD